MQKKFIALAVAALASGAAFAQSNVQIYGVADLSFESVKAEGAAGAGANMPSRNRLQTNSSYLGFKGSEDLGNGLKALFQIETAVNFDNQNGADTAGLTPSGNAYAGVNQQFSNAGNTAGGSMRDTYVALAGNFGTVLAGYVSTPYRSISAGFDVMPGATGIGGYNGVFGRATGAVNLNFRTQAVAYATPTFSGFSGVIAYVPNEGKSMSNVANSVNPGGYNLALNYANGGLKAAYSYLSLTDVGVGGLTDEKHKAHLLAAGYDFGQGTTLNAMYQKFNGDVNAGAGNLDVNRNSYWIGVKHVIGANELAASYAVARDTTGNLFANNGDQGAKQFALRYGYNFSKRTQAYAIYSKVTNDAGASFNFGAGTNTTAAGAGADPTAWGVGVRHSF